MFFSAFAEIRPGNRFLRSNARAGLGRLTLFALHGSIGDRGWARVGGDFKCVEFLWARRQGIETPESETTSRWALS